MTKGKWINPHVFTPEEGGIDRIQSIQCNQCERWITTPYLYYITLHEYCPYCGCQMDKEQAE